MAEINQNYDEKIPDACPHCGNKLSAWQQVLLRVDRALVCKHCWYRILLEIIPEEKRKLTEPEKPKDEAK